jgi:hypothetical protein
LGNEFSAPPALERALTRAERGRWQYSQASSTIDLSKHSKSLPVATVPMKDRVLRFFRAVGWLKTVSKRPGLVRGSSEVGSEKDSLLLVDSSIKYSRLKLVHSCRTRNKACRS